MPRRRALLIGISHYAAISRPLPGAAPDARLIGRALVEGCGFAEEDLRFLLDEAATREAIVGALEALLAETAPGDGALVFFAGHGAQRAQAAPEGEEADGLEEVLVPYDSARAGAGENRDLSDDELAAWLTRLLEKTHEVALIFDCCHSGSLDRREDGRRLPADRRRRVGPRPATRGGVRGASRWLPLSPRYGLLAACRDGEVARELDTPDGRHGALSWQLATALLDPATRALGAEALLERVCAAVTRAVPAQHPQREGPLSRLLFQTEGAPLPGLALGERVGEEIPLLGGAVHGVEAGAIWGVVGPDGAPLGELEIVSVQPLSAMGRPRGPLRAELSGARAVERSRPAATLELALEDGIPEGERERLRAALAARGGARERPEAATRVRWLPARADLAGDPPCPELGALDTPCWAVLRREELVFPPLDAAREGAAEALATRLLALGRVDRLLTLRNPDPWSQLVGRVHLELLRYTEQGLVEAGPDPASGRARFLEGEAFSVAVRNESDREIWAGLLDIGLLGAIGPLWRQGPIPPGGRVVVDQQRRLRLGFPAGFERLRDRAGEAPREGTEHLVLLAGTTPLDPSALAGEGYGDRDAVGLSGELQEDWTAVIRAFTLARSGP